MPVRLQRKVQKNKIRAAQKKHTLKRLMFAPVIKCIDVEEIRRSFVKSSS